jgi:hypothetical protein
MNSLYARIGNAQNELFWFFFLNPSKKKVPALSKSLNARALSHSEREGERGEKTVEIYRVPLLARVRVLFVRAVSFFFLVCAGFGCARLFLTTFFFPVSKSQDIFRFSFCFLGENTQKGDCRTKKKARSDERKRFLFLFFGGKDLFVVLPKRKHTDDESSRS